MKRAYAKYKPIYANIFGYNLHMFDIDGNTIILYILTLRLKRLTQVYRTSVLDAQIIYRDTT